MTKPRNAHDRHNLQKSSAPVHSAGEANRDARRRSHGTFLDRINLPAMSGEEALRRYDGRLRQYAGHGDNQDSGQQDAVQEPELTASDSTLNVQDHQGYSKQGRDNYATYGQDRKTPTGRAASSRADLSALAEWPLLTRIIGLVGTLGMLVALIVLGLFVAGWVNGL
ncbi:hypothetical protein TH25_16290 [Thalassospira profundimaris]|uniref:Uncharacterized protein n=1 Tax=Thalassospira profundimaris TaxID=502049 RepID=A0A367X0R0_9PROT|nr:hypothetical protein [Thalassospira profundimaris]RCK47069.1 hypothetical protein TH25_16290 [Thalassospira profundimaris]